MVAGAVPGGDPRQRGAILGSRIEDEDARRPGRGRVEIGRVGRRAPGRPGRRASSMRPGGCRGDRDTRGTDRPGRACPRSPGQPGPARRAPPARPRRPLAAPAGSTRMRSRRRCSRRRAARATSSLPTSTAAASRSSRARSRWPKRDRRPALERARQLPRRKVEQRGDGRQPRGDRQSTARGVVHRTGRSAELGTPCRPDRRATQQERVDRQRG